MAQAVDRAYAMVREGIVANETEVSLPAAHAPMRRTTGETYDLHSR